VKKVFLGALASLVLAGALSAASDLTGAQPSSRNAPLISDGTSPMWLSPPAAKDARDLQSRNQ